MKRLVRNYEPLPTRKVKVIAAILADAWEVSPAKKAALALLEAGFTAHDIWRFEKSKTARSMDDMWRNNTYNEMRDIEIARRNNVLKNNLDLPTEYDKVCVTKEK